MSGLGSESNPQSGRPMSGGLRVGEVARLALTANYEKIRAGMAQYVCDATAANAARATVG